MIYPKVATCQTNYMRGWCDGGAPHHRMALTLERLSSGRDIKILRLDYLLAIAALAVPVMSGTAHAQSGGSGPKSPTIEAISFPKKVTIAWDTKANDYVSTTKVESDPFKITDAGSAGNPDIIFTKDTTGVGSIKMFSENADGKFAVPVNTGDKRTDKKYILVIEVPTSDLAGAKSAKSVGATVKADPTKLDATLKIASVVVPGVLFELEKVAASKGGGGGGGGNNNGTGGGGGSKGGGKAGGNGTAGGGGGKTGGKAGGGGNSTAGGSATKPIGGRLNFRSSRPNVLAGGQAPNSASIRLSLRGSRTSPLKCHAGTHRRQCPTQWLHAMVVVGDAGFEPATNSV